MRVRSRRCHPALSILERGLFQHIYATVLAKSLEWEGRWKGGGARRPAYISCPKVYLVRGQANRGEVKQGATLDIFDVKGFLFDE